MTSSIWKAICVLGFMSRFVSGMAATEKPGLSDWYSCTERAAETDEAKQAEERGGRFGYEEFVIEKCGFRPVSTSKNGRIALSVEDCETLYRWSKRGDCDPKDFSSSQAVVVKQLNPKVFNLKKFSEWCNATNLADKGEDFSTFSLQVCQTSARAKPTRERLNK